MEQDLTILKDDMVAFIEGHGLRRFSAYVSDEVANVPWSTDEDHPDGWKDFVELAKASNVSFVTMNHVSLDKEDVDLLVNRLQEIEYMNEEELEEAGWLRSFVGKVGYLQLGFPCQGVMFLSEVSTPWYDTYQRLESAADDYDGILIDDTDQDDECPPVRWSFSNPDRAQVEALCAEAKVSPIVARLLAPRGITRANAANFLSPSLDHLH